MEDKAKRLLLRPIRSEALVDMTGESFRCSKFDIDIDKLRTIDSGRHFLFLEVEVDVDEKLTLSYTLYHIYHMNVEVDIKIRAQRKVSSMGPPLQDLISIFPLTAETPPPRLPTPPPPHRPSDCMMH